MRRTQLYIKVNNAWKEIDLFDDIVVPITMKVTDIRQFGSKTSSYSLDFDIPHTNNNAQVFGLNSEIDVYESTFEVGKDYPAYMTNDTFTVFDGQFRLKKVIKKNSGTYIYYVGYLYGGAKTFVDELGTETLVGNDDSSQDLNFSEYTVQGEDMQLDNFVDYLHTKYTDGTEWGLTLIDKTNKAAQVFSGGSQQWYTDECTPYLYALEIFNKIFSKTSYRYDSEFLQGTEFSQYLHDPRWANSIGKYDVCSIIYPFMKNNNNFSNNEVSVNITQLSTTSNCVIARSETFYGASIERYDPIWRTMEFDTTQYVFSQTHAGATFPAYEFTATDYGVYDIKYKFPLEARLLMRKRDDSIITPNPDPIYGRTSIIVGDPDANPDRSFIVYVGIEKNGSLISTTRQYISDNLQGEYSDDSQFGGKLYFENSSYTGNQECYITLGELNMDVNLSGVYLNIGDTLKFYMWISVPVKFRKQGVSTIQSMFNTTETYSPFTTTPCYPKYIEMKLHPSVNPNEPTIISLYSPPSFKEGATFDPTGILNPKTTKLDFFNNFVKMFNLYVEDVSGKTNYKTGSIYPPNTLRIEPYEIFYTPELGAGQSNIKDWTDKIDWESVEYRRCDDYLYNTQSFTKKQDKDFYNDNYDITYKMPYGNREVKGVYCTSDNKNEISLNVSANMCGLVNNQTDTLQCPKVFTLDKSGNIDTKKEYTDGLFFLWHNDMRANTTIGTNYSLKLQSRVQPTESRTLIDYYCADTLNKGYGLDDANLNWGGTENYYQNTKGTIPTYNDLYSAFYSREYEEKTAPDATIMRANAYLTAQDIYNLQLSDMIICNGNYWHILEVNQWKDEKTPCQIELIKTKPSTTPSVVRSKPPVLLDPPVLPIATDNTTLLQQLSQLSEELRDANDRLNNANEQISELEEQLSAIPADILNPNTVNEHKIPLRIVFNDQAVGERKVVSAEVSEQMYNALRSGSWNTSTVSKRGDNATIVLDRTNNCVVPEYITGTATVNLDTMCKPMYERKAGGKTNKPSKSNTTVSKWYAIPGSKKEKPNNVKAKNGMYAASWRYTYA